MEYQALCCHIPQCGNYGNLPPLQRIFVKSIYSEKHFDGIFVKKSWGKSFEITTLCTYMHTQLSYFQEFEMLFLFSKCNTAQIGKRYYTFNCKILLV